MEKLDIKGIIFDYGGTLDTRGDHWSEVIWEAYKHDGMGTDDAEEADRRGIFDKESYRLAYVYAERALAVNPIVTPDFHFKDILREKIALQLDFLAGNPLLETGKDDARQQASLKCFRRMSQEDNETLSSRLAGYIDEKTYALLQENKKMLELLRRAGYPMVLVSNFYGNIRQVLKDAGIEGYFSEVIESAVVGVRKPNPAIFALGVCALDLPASQVLVVGDTYGKDIVPAHQLGCHTLWIKGLQWEEKQVDESLPDGIIHRLSEMEEFLKIS